MNSNNKPNIPKIIFVGIPILLMWWGAMFILLAFIFRDPVIAKYGSISLFAISIPIYGVLSVKNASKLGATIDSEERGIRSSRLVPQGLKRHVTKFDLWFAGFFIIAMPLYFFIGQFVFGINEDQLTGYIKWIVIFAVLLEIMLRKKFGKNNK